MNYFLRKLVFLVAISISIPVLAGPATDALSTCLADHTNGKDRKEMIRWIFIGIAAHPEMKSLSAVTAEEKFRSDKALGELATRLMSDDCGEVMRKAVEAEGPSAANEAFSSLGKVAMQELISNSEVNYAMSGFQKYMDDKKIKATVDSKPRSTAK